MSVAQLEYFIAVAEEQHLSRAALRLHVSQPPLSRHIRALEEEVGTALFERHSSGMRLLPAGKNFLKEARVVVDGFRKLQTWTPDADKQSSIVSRLFPQKPSRKP